MLPAIASQAFLSNSRVAIGTVLFVTASGISIPVKIVAVIRDFPSMGAGSVLIVDQRAHPGTAGEQVSRAAAGHRLVAAGRWPGAGLRPSSWQTRTDRTAVAAALLDNPLSAAPQQGVLAIAVAAALLAALGFSVSVAASMRERRTQSALLAALGVSRAAQAGQLCLEQLMLSVPAAAVGLLLGAGLAHLLIPAVTVTAAATAPLPPVLVDLPLAWAVGLAVAVTAIPVLAAAATVLRRPDPAAQLRAAEAV